MKLVGFDVKFNNESHLEVNVPFSIPEL